MTTLKNDPMMHEILKYYHDELDSWNEVLEYHKRESVSLVRKLSFLIGQQSSYAKTGTAFIDPLMVQRQMTEHLKGLVNTQQLRFDHLTDLSIDSPWESLGENQDVLRIKMRAAERNFSRTQYDAAFFLFASLKEIVLTSRPEVLNKSEGKKT